MGDTGLPARPPFARALVVLALGATVCAAAVLLGDGAAAVRPNVEGWRVDPPRNEHAIDGYTSEVSVAPGDDLHLHVSTRDSARYRIEVHRIGWYGGEGGKLMACLPEGCEREREGRAGPIPAPDPATGRLAVDWPVTEELIVPESWSSGVYVAKLILTSGAEAGRSEAVPFVVRAPADSAHDVVYVASVNTWQAYNGWAGPSTYSDPTPAVAVSFDRPYEARLNKPSLDYPLLRFLDRFGYDVAFTTDVDVDRDRAQLARARLIVTPSHSEYWTKEMRDGFEAARGLGTNLAFLGGNTAYWQVRYADDRRTLLLYRSATLDPTDNPRQETVRWRDPPVSRPECELLGVQWQGAGESTDPGIHGYRVVGAALDHPWFAGTGLRAGDVVKGAVGYEWDAVAPECVSALPEVTVLFRHVGKRTPYPPGLFRSTFHSTDATFVTYTWPASGARILNAASIDFGWTVTGPGPGESAATGVVREDRPPDPGMQRFLRNALDDLSGRS